MANIKLFIKFFTYWIRKKDPIFEIYLKNKKVLDIGCGEGDFLKKDPTNFYGIDINDSALQRCAAKGYKVQKSDATAIPFDNNAFDAIYCRNVIEHLFPDEAWKMIAETKRVLKVGGKCILITPMPKTIWNTFGHIKPYPPGAIKKLFREVSLESFNTLPGLRAETVIYFGSWHLNKITYFFSTIFAQIFSFLRSSYLIIIERHE